MYRPGHHRPLGTVTAAWPFEWKGDWQPELGDVCFEIPAADGDPGELERAFLLVGIEETSSPTRPYRLSFERLAWTDALARAHGGARTWCFYNAPRR